MKMSLTDKEMTSIKQNQDFRNLFQDQKNCAFWDLTIWGHPAWIDSNLCSLSTSAAAQLVIYHRINTALHKPTIAEIIGGVKGVIPNSKLAKYGDYRYDLDVEDMYVNAKNDEEEFQSDQNRRKMNTEQKNPSFLKSSCFETNVKSEYRDTHPANHAESVSELELKKYRTKWLNDVKNVLEGAKRIVSNLQSLDSRTEELINICLRFIYVAKINDSVVKIMDTDIPFVADYEQIPKEPVSRIELLSLPQPEFDGDSKLDLKAVDNLWLKLASLQSRRLWTDWDSTMQSSTEDGIGNLKFPLIKINFLRRYRHSSSSGCPNESTEVPREIATELLGSLLQVIEEIPLESSTIPRAAVEMGRSYFPHPHGEWSNHLFPYRFNSNRQIDSRGATISQKTLVENCSRKSAVTPESTMMAVRFYMSAPPPPIASSVSKQTIVRPPFMYCQTRNGPVKIQTSHPIPQQVQEKIPPVSIACNAFSASIQPRFNSWNYNCPQRFNAPVQLAPHYSRIHTRINPQNYSSDFTEILKHQSETDELHSNAEHTFRRNEVILNAKREKGFTDDREIESSSNNCYITNKFPIPPTSYESRVPFSAHQNVTKNCNIFQPIIYEKTVHQATTSISGMKMNSQSQMHETKMPLKVSKLGINYSLPPPGIHNAFLPRMPVHTHFSHKSTFMGGMTANDLIQMSGRVYYQKNGYDEIQLNQKNDLIDSPLFTRKENSLCCDDKVVKWLETVNQFMDPDSTSLRQSGSSQQTSSNFDKFGHHYIPENDIKYSKMYSYGYDTKSMPANSFDIKDNTHHNHTITAVKYKRKYAKKLLFKHLHTFDGSLKLKKGNDLEGKVKFIKKYFAEISLKIKDKSYLKQITKSAKIKKQLLRIKSLNMLKKRVKSAQKEKYSFEFEIKTEKQHLSNNYSENTWKFPEMNIDEFKVLSRDSYEFNTFPSKRLKLCVFDEGSWTYNKFAWKISCINYFDMLTNDLFFSQKSEMEKMCFFESENAERITGWTHFKIVVKTVLKNISTAFNNRNVRRKMTDLEN